MAAKDLLSKHKAERFPLEMETARATADLQTAANFEAEILAVSSKVTRQLEAFLLFSILTELSLHERSPLALRRRNSS